jgi:hypothetical protein
LKGVSKCHLDSVEFLSALRNPAYTNLDALLQKQVKFAERMGFTIRLEAQNVLNTVAFGDPTVSVTDTNFGYNPHTRKNTRVSLS